MVHSILILALMAAGNASAKTTVPAAVGVKDEGVQKGNATQLDFTGTGVSASFANGIGTINVGSGGTVGISSTCPVGNYIDTATITNGVITGGGCTAISAGSEGNTYTSSKTLTSDVKVGGQLLVQSSVTFQHHQFSIGVSSFVISGGSVTIGTSTVSNSVMLDVDGAAAFGKGPTASTFTSLGFLSFDGNAGITAGLTTTTMTPCGQMFFASSNTVVSSVTIGTVLTTFSTFTVAANTLTRPGDELLVTCVFINQGTAPGTPVNGVYQGASGGASTVMASNASAVANAYVEQRTKITYRTSTAAFIKSEAVSETTAATALVSVTVGAISQQVWNSAADKIVYCRASRATGGTINFAYMKVAKSCQ